MAIQPSQLVLIRHGQSRSNAEEWISSQATCGGLTDLGKAEAATARDRLASMPELAPDAVLVSTMRRAVETAAIVAEPTGFVAEQRAELIEREPGEIEGMTVVDYVAKFGARPFTQWEPALSPGGETGTAFRRRVADAIDRVTAEITAETGGRTTWVVCHGWVITATAHHLSGGEPTVMPPFAGPANAAFCVWTNEGGDTPWRLERYNDHAHTASLANGATPFV